MQGESGFKDRGKEASYPVTLNITLLPSKYDNAKLSSLGQAGVIKIISSNPT